MATLVEEARVVLGLAVEGQIPGVIHVVVLEIALVVRGGLLVTSNKVMTVGNHHSGDTGGDGESNRSEREDVHDEDVDGLMGWWEGNFDAKERTSKDSVETVGFKRATAVEAEVKVKNCRVKREE